MRVTTMGLVDVANVGQIPTEGTAPFIVPQQNWLAPYP